VQINAAVRTVLN
jgi:hypothetical protein